MKVKNSESKEMFDTLIETIHQNADYLSELDGKIGDGDHGINMDKGFQLFKKRIEGKDLTFSEGFFQLSSVLMNDIGGSMGPLYGLFFQELGEACKEIEYINAQIFGKMLNNAIEAIIEIGGAELGDKTLLDTLIPGFNAYTEVVQSGGDFKTALNTLIKSSHLGWLSTKEMKAKIGRASRLGDRSIGVLDAGATSCNLIIKTIAGFMLSKL